MKRLIGITALLLIITGCSGSTKTTESTDSSSAAKISSSTKKSSEKAKKTKVSSSAPKQSETTSTEPTIATQASLVDFVGGWGVPQSGNLFFINADGTYSSATADNVPLDNLTFASLPDGRLTMNSNLGELVRETDGTLTGKGQNYQYLGNLTKEQFLEQKNEGNTTPSSEPTQIAEQTQEAVYVEVLAGEGPAQVAVRSGITLEKLYELNGLTSDSRIMPGMTLRVK